MVDADATQDEQRKPRLLVVTSTFPDGVNKGIPTFVLDLCRQLEAEFSVDVLTPHTPSAPQREVMGTLTVYRYRYFLQWGESLAGEGGILSRLKANPARWLLLPFFVLGQSLALYRLIHSGCYQVVHAHWVLPQGLLTVLVCSLMGRRPSIVCTLHGADLFALRSRFSNALRRFVLQRCDAVTVVSRAMAEVLHEAGLSMTNLRVIPMGTDFTNTFAPSSLVQRKPRRILFVGRLVEKKGLPFLLETMPLVLARYPDAELMVVGEGPERASAQALAAKLGIASRVKWSGWLTSEQLAVTYQEATLAVFPFVTASNGDKEGFGLVVVEAMGCECPVIASDVPALRETLCDGVNGSALSSQQPEAIANAILMLLDDPALQKALGARARQHVVERFGWDHVRREYSALLQQVIRGDATCGRSVWTQSHKS